MYAPRARRGSDRTDGAAAAAAAGPSPFSTGGRILLIETERSARRRPRVVTRHADRAYEITRDRATTCCRIARPELINRPLYRLALRAGRLYRLYRPPGRSDRISPVANRETRNSRDSRPPLMWKKGKERGNTLLYFEITCQNKFWNRPFRVIRGVTRLRPPLLIGMSKQDNSYCLLIDHYETFIYILPY